MIPWSCREKFNTHTHTHASEMKLNFFLYFDVDDWPRKAPLGVCVCV